MLQPQMQEGRAAGATLLRGEGFIKEEQFELGLEGEAHEANQSQENRGVDQEEGENYQ